MTNMSVVIGPIIVLNLFTLINGQPDICSKTPSIIDHCPQASNRWYYNVEKNRCKKFQRGMCTIEENQFSSRAHCRNLCMVSRTFRTNRHLMPVVPPVVSWKEVCLTEMRSDDCRFDQNTKPTIWFFNSSSGVCEQCSFGGKTGFRNKFAELTECKWACINISAQWPCDTPTSYCTIDEQSSSRMCYCRRGFNRRSGSNICQDLNECDQPLFNLCHENGECVNTIGSYYCRCKENYFGDGKTYCHSTVPESVTKGPHETTNVVAKEECEKRGQLCAPEAVCIHSGENYFCQCPEGYRGNGSYCLSNGSLPELASLRECYSNGLICDSLASCFHFGPKYFCQCAQGYFGNGTFCSQVPKADPVMIDSLYCQRNYKFCSPDAHCYHQSPSTYLCKCKDGYSGDGFYCIKLIETSPVSVTDTDMDKCLQAGITCSKHASCKSTLGSYFCECRFGYAGNGIQCTTDPSSCWDPFDKRYTNQCGSYSFQKWFYFDQYRQVCKMFWYGKCFEKIHSRNIFSDEQTCKRLCHYERSFNTTLSPARPTWTRYIQKTVVPISYPLATTSRFIRIKTTTETSTYPTQKVNQTKLPSECLQPCQAGSCSSTMVMYFYNGVSGSCQPFLYTGCGGNSNRFYSLAFCETTCLSPYLKDVEEICLLPLSAGYGKGDKRCELSSRVLYYYNPYSSDCQEFYYYGCGGNENRFSTHAECKIRCMRKIPTSVAILEKRNLRDCFLPKDEGHCEYIPNAPRIRYFYDSENRQCVPFNFNGCGGNENRFGEKEVCENICGGLFKPKSKLCIGWPDSGQCNDINIKWYFNLKTGQCQDFSWTGCAGNTNRFSTKVQCEQTCIG